MCDRDGAMLRKQELRHWFANNVGATQYDGVLARQVTKRVFQQLKNLRRERTLGGIFRGTQIAAHRGENGDP